VLGEIQILTSSAALAGAQIDQAGFCPL
jgi:hypothetical protein